MTDDASPRDDAVEVRALALLRDLLDLDATARDGALLQRTDDAALIARVRELLAQVDESELDAPAPLDLRFGPYRARERIGQGGMGEVFRAERADGSFERHVAIKRMHGGYAGLAARFLRERQLLARLQHPNIAQLIDGGFDAQGQPWLAMELVAGQPIHRWCDLRQATLDTRVRLMIQLCRAIDHAHRHLVVHRDLKPGNVLVDAEGNAKLLDFGIARLLDDDDVHTHTHAMTPAWSAPEQRNGEPATTASDLYQLGLLLRLLLSGFPPSPAPGRMSRQFDDLLLDDRPAARALAEARGTTADALSHRLHGDLDAIVALATAEDPAQRYPAASAFAADLERWLDGLPVAARDTERGYRLQRALRRYWPALAATVAALAFLGYHIHRLDAERERAVRAQTEETRQRQLAEQQRDKAKATADYFATLFELQTPSRVADDEISARELLDHGRRTLQSDQRMPHEIRMHLLIATAAAYGEISRTAEEIALLESAIRTMERHPVPTPDTLANAYQAVALVKNLSGDYTGAQQATSRGLALYDAGKATEPGARLSLLQVQAMLHARAARPDAAADTYRRILAESEGLLHRNDIVSTRVGALTNLATRSTDLKEAESMYREALALSLKGDPSNVSTRLVISNYLASVLSRQGRFADAEALVERNLAEARKHFVEEDPWLGILLLTAGKIDLIRKREARGAQRTRAAYDLLLARLGPANPIVVNAAEDALLGAMAVDAMDDARVVYDTVSRAPQHRKTPAIFEIASVYLPCLRKPTPEAVAKVAETAQRIIDPSLRQRPLVEEIDWAGRCRQRLPGAAATLQARTDATGSVPAPRRTR
jgi:eukaryotic-like serine/threonine-protein kinase